MTRMSTGVRAALHRLERATDLVPLHNSVGRSLVERGIVVEPKLDRYRLTDKGRALVQAMNDPRLTTKQIEAIYR